MSTLLRVSPSEFPLGPATFRSWMLAQRLSAPLPAPRAAHKPAPQTRATPMAKAPAPQVRVERTPRPVEPRDAPKPAASPRASPPQAAPPRAAPPRAAKPRAAKQRAAKVAREQRAPIVPPERLRQAAIATALAPALLWAGTFAYAATQQRSVLARHEALLDKATAVQGRDYQGRLVFALRQPGSQDDRLILRSDQPVPKDFSRMLLTLEDRHADGFNLRHWFGLDVGSLVVNGSCKMLKAHFNGMPPFAGTKCGGTSSLLMLASRGSYNFVGGQGDGEALRDRKTMEIADTIALSMMGPPSKPEVARFIADRLPLAVGPDGTVWGLETASEVLWGLPSDQLSSARLAALASMPKVQLWLTCPGDNPRYVAKAQARWSQIKTRGQFALRRGFAPGAKLDAAIAELAAMPMPTPHKLERGLTRGMSARDACIASGSLGRRGALVSSSLTQAARSELSGVQLAPGEVIREVRLTVDAVKNRTFKLQVEREVRAAEAGQRGKLHIPLSAPNDRAADLLLVVADGQGAIKLHYNNKARNLLNEARRPGSPGKLAVMMAAARYGATPNSFLCNQRDVLTGVRNADGDPGSEACEGAALVSWQEAFGRSLNLPVLKEARELGDARVLAAAHDFGMELPSGTQVANAVVLGQGQIAPSRLQGAMQAIGRAGAGETAVAVTPYVISQVRVDSHWVTPDRRVVDFRKYFNTSSSRSMALAAAGGSVRVQGGTLVGAVSTSAPVSPLEIAKSGTVAGAAPERFTLSKLAVGANVGPGRYSYLGVVAAPKGSLGEGVSVIGLWRLLRTEAAQGSDRTTYMHASDDLTERAESPGSSRPPGPIRPSAPSG